MIICYLKAGFQHLAHIGKESSLRLTGRFDYHYPGVVFTKIIGKDGRALLLINGKRVSLDEWNRQINRFQSMSIKERHPNPLIRLMERLRRLSLLLFAKPKRNEVVVDVGCESGFIAEKFVNRCRKLLMVDIDESLLEQAKRRIKARNVEFICSPAASIALPDRCAGLVLASEILEHVPDEGACLKEMCRLLRHGGRLVVSVPNDALIIKLKAFLRAMRLDKLIKGLATGLAVGHLRVYSPASLKALCSRYGFVRRCRYSFPLPLNIYLELVKR